MFLTGSSNAETFAVPRGASTPYRAGTQYAKTHDVRTGWHYSAAQKFPRVWRQTIPGHLVLWDHEVFDMPNIDEGILWVVYQSDGTLQYIWEGEEHPYWIRSQICPIVTDYPTNMIPSGGGYARALLPPAADLVTVYALIAALTDIPAWMDDTIYGDYYGTGGMVSLERVFWKLFSDLLTARNLPLFFDMTTFQNSSRLIENVRVNLIWLRAASMILYNHEGETAIPLLMDQFIYDADMTRVRRPT